MKERRKSKERGKHKRHFIYEVRVQKHDRYSGYRFMEREREDD